MQTWVQWNTYSWRLLNLHNQSAMKCKWYSSSCKGVCAPDGNNWPDNCTCNTLRIWWANGITTHQNKTINTCKLYLSHVEITITSGTDVLSLISMQGERNAENKAHPACCCNSNYYYILIPAISMFDPLSKSAAAYYYGCAVQYMYSMYWYGTAQSTLSLSHTHTHTHTHARTHAPTHACIHTPVADPRCYSRGGSKMLQPHSIPAW